MTSGEYFCPLDSSCGWHWLPLEAAVRIVLAFAFTTWHEWPVLSRDLWHNSQGVEGKVGAGDAEEGKEPFAILLSDLLKLLK